MANIWDWIFPFSETSVLIRILVLAFWIWMLVDAAKRKFRNDIEKIVWIIIIALGWFWFGSLVYLIVIKTINPQGIFSENAEKVARKIVRR